jgi:hypothetical protein
MFHIGSGPTLMRPAMARSQADSLRCLSDCIQQMHRLDDPAGIQRERDNHAQV